MFRTRNTIVFRRNGAVRHALTIIGDEQKGRRLHADANNDCSGAWYRRRSNGRNAECECGARILRRGSRRLVRRRFPVPQISPLPPARRGGSAGLLRPSLVGAPPLSPLSALSPLVLTPSSSLPRGCAIQAISTPRGAGSHVHISFVLASCSQRGGQARLATSVLAHRGQDG